MHSLIEPHRDATLVAPSSSGTSTPVSSSTGPVAVSGGGGISGVGYAPSPEGLKAERVTDKNPEGAGGETAVQSRLLTKKQISDMAFGIRELAKKLAHIKIKMSVRNVFILAKAHDETLIEKTREVAEWLLKQDANYKM